MMIFQGHLGRTRGLAYAPDGTTLASGGVDRRVRIWDLASGTERAVLQRHRRPVHVVVFSPDGRWLISTDYAAHGLPSAVVWDAETWKPREIIEPLGPEGASALLARLSSGAPRNLAEATWFRALQLGPKSWDASGRAYVRTDILTRGFSGDLEEVRLEVAQWWRADPSNPHYHVRTYFIPVTRAGTRSGAYVPGCDFSMRHSVDDPGAFSPDGSTLALGYRSVILLRDGDERRPRSLAGHRNHVRSLAFAPDGKSLASGAHDGTVRIWDVASGRERACFDGRVGMIDAVAFSPDGMTLAAGGRTGIVVWDVEEA